MTRPRDGEPLSQEIQTFESHRRELLVERGKTVLIHGENIIGTFHCMPDAIAHGYRTLGNVPFLAREILEIDVPASFTRDLFVSSK